MFIQSSCNRMCADVVVAARRHHGELDKCAHSLLLTFCRPCFPFGVCRSTSPVFLSVSTTVYSTIRYDVTPKIAFLGLRAVVWVSMRGCARTVRQAYRQPTPVQNTVYTLYVDWLSFSNGSVGRVLLGGRNLGSVCLGT